MTSAMIFISMVLVLCQPMNCLHFDVKNLLNHVKSNTDFKSLVGEVKHIDVGKILHDAEKDVGKVEDDVQDVVRDADNILKHVLPSSKSTGCHCQAQTYDCGCCVHIDISEIGIDNTICANITYLPHDYGISVTVSLDGKVIIHETISARNPPPLCFDIPELKELASICLDFYDLDISNATFRGCMKLELELVHLRIVHEDLGCFSIPLKARLAREFGVSDLENLEIILEKQKAFVRLLMAMREKKMKNRTKI